MYDIIIIGSGPAGLTAAIYTTRANLKTLVIAGARWGGQLMLTSSVENFPGFPEGIQGPDLMDKMRKQAEHHGAEIIDVNYIEGDFTKQPFKIKAGEDSYESKSVIISTGADTKWLDVPGERERIGRGISSCAPCDAPFFRNKNIVVVGGGDSAMEEAIVLSGYATNVTIIHRRDTFKASAIMLSKAKKIPNIHFLLNAEVLEVFGVNKVEKIKVKIVPNDKDILKKSNKELEKIFPEIFNLSVLEVEAKNIIAEIPIDGIFVAIGHIPNTTPFKGIEIDGRGFIKVKNHFHTNIEGVFVAGDVHDAKYMQAITAAGYGCSAALEAEWWLRDL
ncbi:thioredoxin reductase [Candidatus Levyibacteriota bacterium]|nr:thioredoxin reductase [Candidatus Levybacteria bacterium]